MLLPTLTWTSLLLLLPTITHSLHISQPVPNKGNRKIGIVIDESNSMQTNDPNNTRITAALALNDFLISSDEKTTDKTPDHVSIVGFHDAPELLYPLGDPKGAGAIISNITSNKSGTFIGGGIGVAINETIKPGTGVTANRTGIVVLTDGEDNYSGLSGVQGTINEIKRATGLGIRVSFGFLSTESGGAQNPKILLECLKSGGTFSMFEDAKSQGNFVEQVILKGLTGEEGGGDGGITTLLPGLTTSAILLPGDNPFSYKGLANEALNFTITSLNRTIALKVELRDMSKKGEVIAPSQKTGSTGVAKISHILPRDANVQLVVSSDGELKGEGGIFAVGVLSSLGLEGGRGKQSAAPRGVKVGTELGLLFIVGFVLVLL